MNGLSEAQQRAQDRLLGGVLVAGGGLMTFLCGSCTAYFLGYALWDLSPFGHARLSTARPEEAGWAQLIAVGSLIVGGLPTALGAVLLLIGIRTVRRARGPDHPDSR